MTLRIRFTDAWKSGIGANATKLLCNGGVVLRRVAEQYPASWEPDEWEYDLSYPWDPGVAPTLVRSTLADFISTHQLRPIATQSVLGAGDGDGPRLWLTFVPGGPAMEAQLQLLESAVPHPGGVPRASSDLLFATGAVVYHCRSMVNSYAEYREGSRAQFKRNEALPYAPHLAPAFEFEAVVTGAIRAFDLSRFVAWPLWRSGHQGRPRRMPNSFEKMVEWLGEEDPARGEKLRPLIESHGLANGYRNFIQHNGAYSPHGPFLYEEKSGITTVRMLLPDDPRAKTSREKAYGSFTYTKRRDALEYAYELTVSLLEFVAGLWSEVQPEAGVSDVSIGKHE